MDGDLANDDEDDDATVEYADDEGESADCGSAEAITIDFITGAVSSSSPPPPSSPCRRRGGSCTQHSRGRQQIAQSRHAECQKQQRQQQQLSGRADKRNKLVRAW